MEFPLGGQFEPTASLARFFFVLGGKIEGTAFCNFVLVAAPDARRLSSQPPQSVRRPRCLPVHNGGEKLGQSMGMSQQILTPTNAFLLLGPQTCVQNFIKIEQKLRAYRSADRPTETKRRTQVIL